MARDHSRQTQQTQRPVFDVYEDFAGTGARASIRRLYDTAAVATAALTWAMLWPLDSWLAKLAEGWCLPWIVQPAGGHHRHYRMLLVREDQPERKGASTPPRPGPRKSVVPDGNHRSVDDRPTLAEAGIDKKRADPGAYPSQPYHQPATEVRTDGYPEDPTS